MFFITNPASADRDDDKANAICLDCHNTKDLWSYDGLTKRTLHLTIDKSAFKQSVHKAMRCRDCHQRGYGYVPHRTPRHREPFACLTCHKKDIALNQWDIAALKAEVLKNVHQKKVGKQFDCHACHNPHTYQPPPRQASAAALVTRSNQICQRCHGVDNKRYAKAKDAATAHRFLVNPTHHMEKVKCISCHTAASDVLLHQNLKVEESVRDCNACHAKDSPLLQDQFRSTLPPSKARPGFVNNDVLDNAYVIGATRNLILDRMSLFLVGFILLGAFAHLATRGIRKRRKRHALDLDEYPFYPRWVRLWHGFLGLAFMLLLLTGISLHYTGASTVVLPFRFSVWTHDVAGVSCALAVVFFWIKNLFSGNIRHYIPQRGAFVHNLILQTRFYAIGVFVGDKPPFAPSANHKLNAGQQGTYILVMYVLLPLEAATGMLLLFPELAPASVLGAGGVWPVAMAHLGVAFFLSLFFVIHIYLSTTGKTSSHLFSVMSPWRQGNGARAPTGSAAKGQNTQPTKGSPPSAP